MSQIIFATVEDGVLKPDGKLAFSSGTKVRLTVQLCDEAVAQAEQACEQLDHLCDEFPLDSGGSKLTRDELHERS